MHFITQARSKLVLSTSKLDLFATKMSRQQHYREHDGWVLWPRGLSPPMAMCIERHQHSFVCK